MASRKPEGPLTELEGAQREQERSQRELSGPRKLLGGPLSLSLSVPSRDSLLTEYSVPSRSAGRHRTGWLITGPSINVARHN